MPEPSGAASAPEAVKALVSGWIAPILKERGYARRGSTWHQDAGPLTRVFQVQRSSRNTAQLARFYLNGAVYAGALDELLGRAALSLPDEASAHLRLRPNQVNEELSASHDLAPDTPLDEVGPIVAAEVNALLDRMEELSTVDELVDALSHSWLAQYERVYGWYLHTDRPGKANAFRDRLHGRFGQEARWQIFEQRMADVAARLGQRDGQEVRHAAFTGTRRALPPSRWCSGR